MFRRFVAALLIASYAASPLAAMPHAHASQPAGHGEHPHMHVGLLKGLLAGDGDSHHHHKTDHQQQRPSHSHHNGKSLPSPAPTGDHGHNDDSIYLPDITSPVKEARTPDLNNSKVDVIWLGPVAGSAHPAVPSARHEHLSCAMFGDDCALYLTLRTLRI
jgi:hypothetical protein